MKSLLEVMQLWIQIMRLDPQHYPPKTFSGHAFQTNVDPAKGQIYFTYCFY